MQVEFFADLIVFLEDCRWTLIFWVIKLFMVTSDISYEVHRYLSIGILPCEEFFEDLSFPDET